MILHWLKSGLTVVVLGGALCVTTVQKMVTEDYRPWKGDSLSDLTIVRGPSTIRIRMVEDSPELRSVLSRYAGLQTPLALHDQRPVSEFAPDLSVDRVLLRELEGFPYFEVPGGSNCKILARTEVRCRRDKYTSTFVKVRITSGTKHGREGLVCDSEIPRTVAMP